MNELNTPIFPGISHLCPDCLNAFGYDDPSLFEIDAENETILDEGSFSWHACECCNCHLGGMRFYAHSWENDELIHYSICSDCVYMLANGSYPDDYQGCK